MVGFDDDDRKFRPKKPMRLECEKCGANSSDVMRRTHWYFDRVSAVICARCWHLWTLTSDEKQMAAPEA